MLLAKAELRNALNNVLVLNLQSTTQREQLIKWGRVCAAGRNQRRLDMGANRLVAVAAVAAPIELQLSCFCISHAMFPFLRYTSATQSPSWRRSSGTSPA